MSRFVPWALVALCFVLGVASRSISDTFTVFVPALQGDFAASRSAITLVYAAETSRESASEFRQS